ncbi:FHA domain-containing protein [Chloroflexota bacterium]
MKNRQRQQRNILVYMILAIVVIVVIVLGLAFGGGGGGDVPSQPGQLPADIPDTTQVLESSTTQYLAEISPDVARYTFSQSTPDLDELGPGDIIVSDASPQAPNGFLRKVENVSQENGQVIIDTSPAALTDAIETGEIHVSQKLTSADIQSSNIIQEGVYKLAAPVALDDELIFKFKDIVLYDEDGDLNTWHDQLRGNGEISLAPTINFDLVIRRFDLKELLFSIELEAKSKLEVEAGIDLLSFRKEIEIAHINLKPFTVWVGHVPVVLTPVITVHVGVDGDVSVGIKNALVTTHTYTAGLTYLEAQGWGIIKEHSENTTYEPVRVNAKSDFKFYVPPKILLMIYGTVGPYGSGQIYFELEADPFMTPWWKLWGGLNFGIGVRFEILDKKIADHSEDVIAYRVLLAQAEEPFITATPSATQDPQVAPTSIFPLTPFPTNPNATVVPLPTTDVQITPIPLGGDAQTVMVFDTSGSMREMDQTGITKLEAAKRAGGNILDILDAEAGSSAGFSGQIGLVRFSSDASVPVPLTTNISEVRRALQQFSDQGGTRMAAGLLDGIELLRSSNTNSKKIMILLSDGLPNILLSGESRRDHDPQVREEILELAAQAGQYGICIYTVGFGQPLSGGGSIDEELLREIARVSGCGEYYAALDATQLANVYVELRHASTGNVLLHQGGNISQGQEVQVAYVDVPQYQSQVLLTINWPSGQIEPVLIDPNAQVVDQNYPGASFAAYQSLSSVIIQDPITGQWQVIARGGDIPQGGTSFNAILSSRPSPITPTPTDAPPTPTPQPVAPASPGFPVVILVLALGGGAVAIYVLTRITGRLRTPYLGATTLPGKAYLLGRSGDQAGRSLAVGDGWVIGRGRACQIKLTGPYVSRQHARFRYSQGGWFIQDLQSATGTYVNNIKVSAVALKPGDRIRIGSSELEFHSG